MNYSIGNIFNISKTEDKFVEVKFVYDYAEYSLALPLKLTYQGFELNEEELESYVETCYKLLHPENREEWILNSNNYWEDKLNRSFENDATYNVLNALYSGEWECRVCGPVPQANPQPAARLRDLKKFGYTICTKNLPCPNCGKNTTHDLLVMIPIFDISNSKQRFGLSPKLSERIKKVLGYFDVASSVKRPSKELIIDHKFPSQRWTEGETENPNDMSDEDIKNKFQLLTNQTNLLKSKICDRCIFENIRGDFNGITWYYKGDKIWRGEYKSDENGCVGCPWYDLERWKKELHKSFSRY